MATTHRRENDDAVRRRGGNYEQMQESETHSVTR